MAQTPVLVTGAAGFIGSRVAAELLRRGRPVVGLDNFDPFYPRPLKERNLRFIEQSVESTGGDSKENAGDPFRFIEADIRDPEAVAGAMAAAGGGGRGGSVIHLAARAGVRPSIQDLVGYADVNVRGTAVILDAAAKAGIARIVIASSSSVYGNNDKVPFAEDDPVEHPISPYAATKRCGELIAHTHWHLTGMPTACLRFFTVYGPGQRPDLAIGAFMRCIAAGEPIRMFGDGSTSRDYTYIDDIVAGVLAAEQRIDGYRVWNLGGNEPVSLADMIKTVAQAVGREPVIQRLPMQPGDVQRTFADLTRAAAELDYHPTTRFPEGIRRQWQWLQSEPPDVQ